MNNQPVLTRQTNPEVLVAEHSKSLFSAQATSWRNSSEQLSYFFLVALPSQDHLKLPRINKAEKKKTRPF